MKTPALLATIKSKEAKNISTRKALPIRVTIMMQLLHATEALHRL